MESVNKIVVVLQQHDKDEAALERGLELSKRTGGHIVAYLRGAEQIEGVAMLKDPEKGPAIRAALETDKHAYIDQLIEKYNAKDVVTERVIDWEEHPFVGIIRTVLKHKADLVIKESRHHSRLKTLIFTPTDWHLLRKCPTPVWLTHGQTNAAPKRIVAAVSSVYVDEIYQKLDARVLAYTRFMAQCFDAEIKVVNAYSVVPLGISLDGTGIYQDEYLLDLEKQHHEQTVALAEKYGIASKCVETRNGETPHVIAEAAREFNADLVIVGTVARQGIAGIFIGNTAETTLELLDCDIITLKQENFVSPIGLE